MRGGFDLETVKGFTLRQLRAFTAAVERARTRENRDILVMMRGSQYGKADFKKLLEAMEP